MIALLVVWLTDYFNGWLRLHEEIKGRWHVYLWNWFWLYRYRRSKPRSRLDLHDPFGTDLASIGFIPFPEETAYANPKRVSLCGRGNEF